MEIGRTTVADRLTTGGRSVGDQCLPVVLISTWVRFRVAIEVFFGRVPKVWLPLAERYVSVTAAMATSQGLSAAATAPAWPLAWALAADPLLAARAKSPLTSLTRLV